MRSDHLMLPGRPSIDTLGEVIAGMNAPGFELDAHEAAAILSAIDTARANGHPFDPMTLALANVLKRQLARSDDGAAADYECCVDDGQEDDRDFIPDEKAGVAA